MRVVLARVQGVGVLEGVKARRQDCIEIATVWLYTGPPTKVGHAGRDGYSARGPEGRSVRWEADKDENRCCALRFV